jgi:uncharacterized repeat protein (TIGR01451 family)
VVNHNDNTVSQYRVNPKTGALKPMSPATVPTGHYPSEVAVAPNGKRAYGTDLTDDAVSQYNINSTTGKLSAKSPATVAAGARPSGIAVSPNGKAVYAVNSFDNTVSQYTVNAATGALTPKSPATVATGNCPDDIALTADGKSAYLPNECDDTLSQYNVNPSTGVLSAKSPATVGTANDAITLAVTPDADVSVKLGAPTSVKSGSQLTYKVTVWNRGPSRAWDVKLTDHLPFGTQFVKASTSLGQCGASGRTVTCRLSTLGSGKHARIQIEVSVTASHAAIRDAAGVTSVTPDPRRSNDAAKATTKVR